MSKNGQPEEFTAIDEAVSTTGKWAIAYGQHFRPTLCYDIIALNRFTGEAMRVHYNDHKEIAMAKWEAFKEGMTAPRAEGEEDEPTGYKIFGPN